MPAEVSSSAQHCRRRKFEPFRHEPVENKKVPATSVAIDPWTSALPIANCTSKTRRRTTAYATATGTPIPRKTSSAGRRYADRTPKDVLPCFGRLKNRPT